MTSRVKFAFLVAANIYAAGEAYDSDLNGMTAAFVAVAVLLLIFAPLLTEKRDE